MEQEVIVIFAGTQGFLDDVPVNRIQEFQTKLLEYISASAPQVKEAIATKKELSADIDKDLRAAITAFKTSSWK